MNPTDIVQLETLQQKRRNDLRREYNVSGGAKRKRRSSAISGEKTKVQKEIVQQFDKRSFHRIQMQIPFGESSIIFLTETSRPETSSFWTNMLVHLVSYDVQNNGGKVFFPKGSVSWGDGLVQLPALLNIGRKKQIVNLVLRRILDTQTSTGIVEVDRIIDDCLANNPDIQFLKSHDIAKENPTPTLSWYCPNVPPGGIVVWHGFHTTKGDDDDSQFRPKATLFMDYAERNLLGDSHFEEYTRLLRAQPFDPGAGSGNTRGSRTTIEFNAAKNIPQACPALQVDTRMVGGDTVTNTVGRLDITKEDVLHQGFAVIAPVLRTESTPVNCHRWEMSQAELDRYNALRQRTKGEFERFLTYHLFERELRFLACWLSVYTTFDGYRDLWKDMKTQVDLFNDRGKFMYKRRTLDLKRHAFFAQVIRAIKDEGNDPAQVPGNDARAETMSKAEYTLFNMLTLHQLAKHSRALNVTAVKEGLVDKAYAAQERCWKAIFGGKKLPQRKAAAETFNDPYFMYWRYRMGNSKGMMCTGSSLDDLNAYVEKKVKEGFYEHAHGRNPQAGGIKISKDSGMGGATTYVGGEAHTSLQIGEFGTTLANAFYNDPIVVLERFRVKTHASWGAGHVDHAVRSRLSEIVFE